MKAMARLSLFGVVLVLLALLVAPAIAQDNAPGAGEGAPIIEANLGNDIATLNPILASDGASQEVIYRLYPNVLPVDVETVSFTTKSGPNAPGALVKEWSVSADGLTYTLQLRDDWKWTDGSPVTSADYKYGFDAIASGETKSPLVYVLDKIQSVEAPDPKTVIVKLKAANCAAPTDINAVPVVPSETYKKNFPTFKDMNDSPLNLKADVTSGAFKFANFRPGEQVTLAANQDYPDKSLGKIVSQGWIYKNVSNETLIYEQFVAGDLTFAGAPTDRKKAMRELGKTGKAQVFETPSTNLQFIGFNTADPKNPQNGLDDKGQPIDQGHHPILGDVRVRQALLHAMDWTEVNAKGYAGEGVQLASHALPTSWAFHKDLKPYAFDLEKANQLLTEAGWIDDDNNPETPRVAKGAKYAPDGAKLSFKLETNAGNEQNAAIGVLLQDQWKKAGVQVDFQAIDFNVLVQNLTGQTFDAIMLFWGFSVPDNPDDTRANFDPKNDVVGSGFNVSSYNNPELTKLLDDAATVPSCDITKRAELYKQVQEILRNDAPWIWVGTTINVYGAQPNLVNWRPRPGLLRWNIDSWYMTK